MSWGAFAGGVARGIQTEQEMRMARERNAREKQTADDAHSAAADAATERKRAAAVRDDVAAAGANNYAYTGQNFEGLQSFDSPTAAAQMGATPATTPPAAPVPAAPPPRAMPTPMAIAGTASTSMPTSSQAAMPATPAAMPATPAASAPPATPPATPPTAYRQVQDPITHRWFNVDASQTREKSVAEQSRDIAAVYMRHGQADQAMAVIRDGVQAQLAQSGLNKQERTDALESAQIDPAKFAQVTTSTLSQLGVHANVTPVPVDLGGGKKGFALQFNMSGTDAPPFYFDKMGNMTHDPKEADYGATSQRIMGMVKGDTAGALAGILTQQAQVQSIVASKHSMGVQDKELALRSAEVADNRKFRAASLGLQAKEAGSRAALISAQIEDLHGAAPPGVNRQQWKLFNENVARVIASAQGDKTYGQAMVEVLSTQPKAFQDAIAAGGGGIVDTTGANQPSPTNHLRKPR